MKILITGAQGLLGSEFCRWLKNSPRGLGTQIVPWDLPDFDITDADRVQSEIKRIRPAAIFHLAALTDVDGCELEPDKAYRVNTVATGSIVEAAYESDSVLCYLSTDYVFDGKKGEPYDETDRPGPLCHYGKTKLAGERMVRERLTKFFIVRTAGLYGTGGKNFVDTILSLAHRGEPLAVVSDQITSPTSARDLAPALEKLIGSSNYGIYHITNAGFCSWFEFARTILGRAGLANQIVPIMTVQSGRRAPRPAFSALDCQKFERTFGERFRSWNDALADYLSRAG